MNKVNKLALLSLLAIAAFVPQQSHAVKLTVKQWLGLGTALTFGSVAAYQIYESISTRNQEINEKIKELEERALAEELRLAEINEKKEQVQKKTDDLELKNTLTEEELLKVTTELEEKVEKQKKENEELKKQIELKILEKENLKSSPKRFVANIIVPTESAIYAGSKCEEINKKYGIEHEIDALSFTDLCGVLYEDRGRLYIPLKLLSKNYLIWSEYFSKNNKEHPNKVINIGSCEIDLNGMHTSGIKAWYKNLNETQYNCLMMDQKELIKRGASFNATIERKKINEQSDEIFELRKKVSTLKKELRNFEIITEKKMPLRQEILKEIREYKKPI